MLKLIVLSSIFWALGTTQVVQTPNGLLQGIYGLSSKGKVFREFRGVQFGRTPGRFEDSIGVEPWEGIKLAENYGPQCSYIITSSDEDCLFLNVYAPLNSTSSPVLVYIHGGSFQSNSNQYYGPNYLLNEEIILVVIQYRLGIFGFLSTGDAVAPGNYGLKDQVMALRWIQENIESFGGNKNLVTIMGQSAGGASVTYHLVSPMSQNLFQRGIAQSGTFLAPWALTRNPKHYAEKLANHLGCPISDTYQMVSCLKTVPIEFITDYCMKRNVTIKWHADPLAAFGPVIEPYGSLGAFIDQDPYDLLVTGNISKVPLLTGVVKEEGVYLWTYYIMYSTSKSCDEPGQGDTPWLYDLQTRWMEIAPQTLYFDEIVNDEVLSKEISKKILEYYFGTGEPENLINRESFYNLSRLYSDRLFVNSGMEFMSLYSKLAPTFPYLYVFNKYWGLEFGNHADNDQAIEATHAAELDMLFSPLFNKIRNTTDHNQLSESIVNLWVSFSRDGFPSQLYGSQTEFPELNPGSSVESLVWYVLDSDTKVTDENPFKQRYEFWTSLNISRI